MVAVARTEHWACSLLHFAANDMKEGNREQGTGNREREARRGARSHSPGTTARPKSRTMTCDTPGLAQLGDCAVGGDLRVPCMSLTGSRDMRFCRPLDVMSTQPEGPYGTAPGTARQSGSVTSL